MLQKDTGMIIKQISDALEKKTNNELREDGLTLTQSGFLTTLYFSSKKDLTMSELEEQMNVTQPTAFGVISRLCEKNLVETYNEKNSRAKHVLLTKQGIEKCEHARSHMKEAETLLNKNLSNDEQKIFRELLIKVRDGLLEDS